MKRKRNKTMKQKKKKPIFCWQKKCEKGCLVVKKKRGKRIHSTFLWQWGPSQGERETTKEKKKEKEKERVIIGSKLLEGQ